MSKSMFKDRVALVTGGNAGIGKACSIAFAAEGVMVIIAARREDASLAVVKEIQDQGGKACFIKTDLSRDEDIEHLFQKINSEHRKLDFAVNNVGMTGPTGIPFEERSLKDWNMVMNLNLTSVFRSMQEEIKIMKKQQHGVITNVSSVAGLVAGLASPVYTASKHGIIGLTRHAAKELGPFNIRVNAMCPGMTDTDMTAESDRFRSPALLSRIPLGRLGKPEEIANAILWLCSDASSFVTGSTLLADGGYLA